MSPTAGLNYDLLLDGYGFMLARDENKKKIWRSRFAEAVKATYPYYAVRLLGGVLFFAGMLIMAWNVWKTVAGQRAIDDAKIPAVALAHA